MSKAILVIDIPDKSIEDWVVEELKIIKYDIDGNFIDGNDYCHGKVKLKPMPEKIPQKMIDEEEEKNLITNACRYKGWNDCINEILKNMEGQK